MAEFASKNINIIPVIDLVNSFQVLNKQYNSRSKYSSYHVTYLAGYI